MLLKNFATGLCADLPDYGRGRVGGPVNQFYCQPGATDNQIWSLQLANGLKGPDGEALFVIRNQKDNLCMDIPYWGADTAGTKVSEYPCDLTRQDNQLWYLTRGDQQHYQIRNYASDGLCLRATGGHSPDTQLDIDVCNSTADDWAWTAG
ncbi:RICIN domain-containing protein [Streptomyces sp. NPDC094468]|uniref:RICIN domain-containing protein n=1 Tax=Streptomyces sp. NPDC094468 TaxID=3366066 RepID=UPI0037FBD3F4